MGRELGQEIFLIGSISKVPNGAIRRVFSLAFGA
jgi:hypothetical protein